MANTPSNIPTSNPYISPAGVAYVPMGEQGGHILASSYDNLYAYGSGSLPNSNDYSLAIVNCSATCDGNPDCQSFNLFTVQESDYNGGTPTWECRFSNKLYDKADYTTNYGTPSYVWSVSTSSPTCNVTGNPAYTPQTWVNAGMDAWLAEVAARNNLLGNSQDFASSLMNALGWTYYTCDSDPLECSITENTNAKPCSNWLNIQIANYQTYISGLQSVISGLEEQFSILGNDLFTNLWFAGSYTVPTSNAFNPISFIKDMIGLVAALVPIPGGEVIGRFTETMLEVTVIPSLEESNNDPTEPIPPSAKFWTAIMTTYDQQFHNLSSSLHSTSARAMNTSDLFTAVTDGGAWFIPKPLLPSGTDVWTSMVPYFSSKLAMQAMAAQQVFVLGLAPAFCFESRYGKKCAKNMGTTCTQAMADEYGSYFTEHQPYQKGSAFCSSDGSQVMVPLVGFTPFPVVYNNFVNVAPYLASTVSGYGSTPVVHNATDIIDASQSCEQARPLPESDLSLYYSPSLLSAGMSPTSAATQECVWSLPVFDWSAWYPEFYDAIHPSHWSIELTGSTGLDMQGMMHNYISFIAYQLKFQPSINTYFQKRGNPDYEAYDPWTSPLALNYINQNDSAVLSTKNVWGV